MCTVHPEYRRGTWLVYICGQQVDVDFLEIILKVNTRWSRAAPRGAHPKLPGIMLFRPGRIRWPAPTASAPLSHTEL